MYADYEMAEIIHKACAFKPEDRYQDPNEMKQALVEYMKRNQSDDTLIVPPISGEIEPVDPNAEDESSRCSSRTASQWPRTSKRTSRRTRRCSTT